MPALNLSWAKVLPGRTGDIYQEDTGLLSGKKHNLLGDQLAFRPKRTMEQSPKYKPREGEKMGVIFPSL